MLLADALYSKRGFVDSYLMQIQNGINMWFINEDNELEFSHTTPKNAVWQVGLMITPSMSLSDKIIAVGGIFDDLAELENNYKN